MGLLTQCNASINVLSTHFLNARIILEGKAKDLGKVFMMVNLYGPYREKKTLWDLLND